MTGDLDGPIDRVGKPRWRQRQPGLPHRGHEPPPVLGPADRLEVRADHPNAVRLQRPGLPQGHGEVQPGLPAERGKKGVWPLPLDHPEDRLEGERLDVGGVGELGVGHDRGRVRVHQHDPVSLGPQRLAGLGPGVVELAGLADDDGARPDDQDRADVLAPRH
jgi:hypothetical protein